MTQIKLPEAFADLVKPARYKCYYGGRGSGKSHSIAAALLLIGASKPIRVLCCREVQRSIRDSVKRLLDDKIEAFGLSNFYTSTDTEVRGKNGTLFVFAGLRTNPDSIKSMEGIDIAWVEEAHAISQRSLDFLIPTIRKPGSELIFSWNPDQETNPIEVFRASPPPDCVLRKVSWRDNPWFPDVLKREMEWDKGRDPEKYAHVWEGEYSIRSETRVFTNWRVEEFTTPEDVERLYFGADWGYSVDPTVLIRAWIDGRTLYVDHEAYAVGVEIDETPDLFRAVPGADEWPICADSARPETISYMRRQGFDIKSAKKGPNSVMDGIEFLRNYDIVVHPRCRHTIDELTHYRWKTDPNTDEVLPVLQDKDNHVIDALRYAVESTRRAKPVNLAITGAGKMDNWARVGR